MKYILSLLLQAFSVLVIAKFLPGVHLDTFATAIWVALVIGILNVLVKPILVVLTLPITVVTLGLFLLIINAIIIYLAAYLTAGFSVSSLWVAWLFSLFLTVISSILSSVLEVN